MEKKIIFKNLCKFLKIHSNAPKEGPPYGSSQDSFSSEGLWGKLLPLNSQEEIKINWKSYQILVDTRARLATLNPTLRNLLALTKKDFLSGSIQWSSERNTISTSNKWFWDFLLKSILLCSVTHPWSILINGRDLLSKLKKANMFCSPYNFVINLNMISDFFFFLTNLSLKQKNNSNKDALM